jgi:putative tryptophan/tyrosine transport system substrate-binding protein
MDEVLQRAALFIARTLKGEKPADLPAEQPMRYHLAVNLKTATTLGLTFPPSLILRTDDVVQ